MKEHVQKTGVRKYAGDDLIELQAEPLKVLQTFFAEYFPCVLKGVEVTSAEGENNLYNVAPGIVSLAGTDADGADTFKVVPFAGVEAITLPIYLTLTYTVSERVYGDGKVKPIAYNYTAAATNIQPADVPFLEITTTGGKRFLDVIKLTEKLDKVGNGKDVTVTFAEAAERVNVSSGEKLSGLFGKVQKWFAGLKAVAFTGKAADLEQDANNRLVTDTEKTAWADKYTKAQTYTRTEVDNKDTAALQAAKEYAAAKIAEVVNSAPGTLDTLQELAKALGDDPNFATSITALIGGKADRVHGHAISEVTNLQSELDGKALKNGNSAESFTADAFFANKLNESFNRPQHSGIEMLSSSRKGIEGAPGQYWSALSVLSNYVGFQLATYGGGGESFYFRKQTGEGIWAAWRELWHSGNFNPALKANVNHGHSVMYSEDIFVGGSINLWYPVRIPIREDGVNRFVIRRSVHEDSPDQGSLRAEFITTYSGWGHYVNFIKCINLTASNHGCIANCKCDCAANKTSCVVWLRGSRTYHIDYYYVPNSSAQVLLETTNIGSPTYPQIVSPTTEIAAEFAGGDIYPVTSTQLNLKADSDHNHGDIYAPKEHSHNYAASDHNHTGTYEPAFKKNGAFNKNFGTTAGTVAEGNHTHEGVMKLYSRCKVIGSSSGATLGRLAGVNIQGVVRLGAGHYKITHNADTNNYIVILNGQRANDNYDHPIFVAIGTQTNISFEVKTADDNTPNDSIFEFTILTY